MTRPDDGVLRAVRALVLALATTCLAAVAHLLGGGALPGPGVVAVLLAVVAAGSVVASSHRLGAHSLSLLLAGGQLGLHEAFMVLGRSGAGAVPTPGVHAVLATGHLHHAHDPAALHAAAAHLASTPGAGHLAHTAGAHAGHHHGGLTMLLAHVLAAVVTGVLLARGEHALWVVTGWLRPAVRPALARPAHWPRPALPALPAVRLTSLEVVLTVPRRGPPLRVCS